MLNILLSFAQFEREVTGERIRDKIAASKRKGLWMGGHPPLGYDVKSRRLVVNGLEAKMVRRIFEDFVRLRSSTAVARGLAADGIGTKSWTTQDGRHKPGGRIDKKYLHKVLRNRIYLGEIAHKGNWYLGQHEPIVAPELWGPVHAILTEDVHERAGARKPRGPMEVLLRGLLYDPSGERMYPTFTRKNGRQYRYYVSKSELRFGAAAKTYERIPADEVEAATVAQIKTVLGSPEAVAAVCGVIEAECAGVDEAHVVLSLTRLGDVWERLFAAERQRLVSLMIERVDLVQGGLKIKWRALGWQALIGEFAPQTLGAELVEQEATD